MRLSFIVHMTVTILKILGGVAALVLGIWFGRPGRYEQSASEIEKVMRRGGSRRNRVKRAFTPLDWFRRDERGSERRASRRYFGTAVASPSDPAEDTSSSLPAAEVTDDPGDGEEAAVDADFEIVDEERA